MGRFLAITGTPGTGKKTLAPAVAKELGLPCVGLNQLLSPGELRKADEGVDTRKLRGRLLATAKGTVLVYGHLVPDVLETGDVRRVVVLRCEPKVLRRRLLGRGYAAPKLRQNLEAELIGVVFADSVKRFGFAKCAQFDSTSRKVRESVRAVARLLGSRKGGGAAIDWVPRYSSAEKLRSLLSDARTDSAFT